STFFFELHPKLVSAISTSIASASAVVTRHHVAASRTMAHWPVTRVALRTELLFISALMVSVCVYVRRPDWLHATPSCRRPLPFCASARTSLKAAGPSRGLRMGRLGRVPASQGAGEVFKRREKIGKVLSWVNVPAGSALFQKSAHPRTGSGLPGGPLE